jgi:PKD repeat protein
MHIIQARTIETRRVVARRFGRLGWLPVLAAFALGGCTVNETEAPPLAGPSELGLSLELRATPDTLTMDGLQQSQIQIVARGPDGQPVPNRAVRVEITQGGAIVDLGRLNTKNVTTGSDGRAVVTYTAPAGPPSQNSDPGTFVTIIGSPAESDWRSSVSRRVDIRLTPQGAILPIAFAPVPRFTFSPSDPLEDAEIIFDASSSIPSCVPDPTAPNDVTKCIPQGGAITSYQWDFGDGKTGSGVQARTYFRVKGTYVVKLTVTNDRGLSNSVTQEVTVAEVANPTADFNFSPASPGAGQSVFFDASASKASTSDRHIATYSWTFGDGGTGTGQTTSRRYAQAGSYTVTLTVADSSGRTGTASKNVTVGAGLQPVANFTISPAQVTVGQRVFFDGTVSTPPPGRTITRYQWNLGENNLVEGARVDTTYSRAGGYTVTLTVTDSGGATHSITKTLTIQ